MTKYSEIKSCTIGPAISAEQFIPEHFFLFLAKGKMDGYDGSKNIALKDGECCIVRRYRLARYNKQKENDTFEKVIIIFDQPFLKSFLQKYKTTLQYFRSTEAFIKLKKDEKIVNYLLTLNTYFTSSGKIDPIFCDLKREELLLIILQQQPELSGLFFDFSLPGKINLEEFMNRNFRFNVSLERFACMTGRSISAFKRDFKEIFKETPNRWLVQKRLEEAHFLLQKSGKTPSEIFMDLGFEDLSHFSFAFTKKFGKSPSEIEKIN